MIVLLAEGEVAKLFSCSVFCTGVC